MKNIIKEYFSHLLVVYFSLDITLKGKLFSGYRPVSEIAIVRCDDIDKFFVHTDVLADDKLGVEQHLELGKQFLSQGQLNDALFHYDEAISECP